MKSYILYILFGVAVLFVSIQDNSKAAAHQINRCAKENGFYLQSGSLGIKVKWTWSKLAKKLAPIKVDGYPKGGIELERVAGIIKGGGHYIELQPCSGSVKIIDIELLQEELGRYVLVETDSGSIALLDQQKKGEQALLTQMHLIQHMR
ncbi:MAG: hypothetical protein ACWA5R_03435 [bacterium]